MASICLGLNVLNNMVISIYGVETGVVKMGNLTLAAIVEITIMVPSHSHQITAIYLKIW